MHVELRHAHDLLCGYPQQVFRFYGQHLGLHESLVSVEQQRAHAYKLSSVHICHPVSYRVRVWLWMLRFFDNVWQFGQDY